LLSAAVIGYRIPVSSIFEASKPSVASVPEATSSEDSGEDVKETSLLSPTEFSLNGILIVGFSHEISNHDILLLLTPLIGAFIVHRNDEDSSEVVVQLLGDSKEDIEFSLLECFSSVSTKLIENNYALSVKTCVVSDDGKVVKFEKEPPAGEAIQNDGTKSQSASNSFGVLLSFE
jgi:hypothetical protein